MIVVAGEALMDVFDAGATGTGQALDARIGGSPFNVALGLARLAQPVALCACVSTGFLGERLMAALASEGIDTRCVQRVDAPTSMCLIGLDAQGVPRYDFLGEKGADRQLTAAVLEQVPGAARALHFGSYAMVVPPVAATQRALVEREHRRLLISYDPNVRPTVEPDLPRWRDTFEWMLPRTHLLKLSAEDLELLHPGVPIERLATAWARHGVRLVVLTRGADGAIAFHAAGRVEVPPVPMQVADTVGAGDTFQAALLTWLAEHGRLSIEALASLGLEALGDMLRFAAKAAALTCSRRGADLPYRRELMP